MKSEVLSFAELKKADPVFGQLSFDNHEQIVFCNDKDTGLKAIIGIHSTILGPALGGTRMWPYANEWEALNDVLRLSRGMTFKAAITGLNLGGGKAVIMGNSKTQKSPELMKRFASFVHSLGGKYITAEDVGMETSDMDLIKGVTPYVTGISKELGGAGNPSPVTAYGVYIGLKAGVRHRFGSDKLEGLKIVVQGVGHVGETLVSYLVADGAEVMVTDIDKELLELVSKKYGVKVYMGEDIFTEEMDVYAPCALGATLNGESISKLTAKVVAGAANNQLANEEEHGKLLMKKGIIYAPDFVINAGGIINVYAELEGYSRKEIKRKTENIYNTALEIFAHSEATGCTPHVAALNIARSRIDARKLEQ